jgi:hypothetical protein
MPEVAVMIVVPGPTAVAKPLLFMVATAVSDDVQVTCVVTSLVLPSLNQPSAVNCWVAPAGMLGLAGETTIPLRATSPAQAVRDRAKDPKNNMRKTKVIFLMGTTPGIKRVRRTRQDAGSRGKKQAKTLLVPIGPSLNIKRASFFLAPGRCRGDNRTVILRGDKPTPRLPLRGRLPGRPNS